MKNYYFKKSILFCILHNLQGGIGTPKTMTTEELQNTVIIMLVLTQLVIVLMVYYHLLTTKSPDAVKELMEFHDDTGWTSKSSVMMKEWVEYQERARKNGAWAKGDHERANWRWLRLVKESYPDEDTYSKDT